MFRWLTSGLPGLGGGMHSTGCHLYSENQEEEVKEEVKEEVEPAADCGLNECLWAVLTGEFTSTCFHTRFNWLRRRDGVLINDDVISSRCCEDADRRMSSTNLLVMFAHQRWTDTQIH